MSLFLGLLSCFISLYFCFYASNILSWWLSLCSIVWSQEGWFLQLLSSFSWLLSLFQVFYVSTWIVNFFFSSSVKNVIGNLIGSALHLNIVFSSIVIFTVLILLPRNMKYLSICLCHLWFLSLVSYNFLFTVLLYPWVSLFLDILFYLLQWWMGLIR